ncbi:MAG: hypothetical protein LCH39_02615 [Proteobacteria bacterium]|nr:hypothetical protein [Pseudomonadota bacterium]
MLVTAFGVATEYGGFGLQVVKALMSAVHPDGHFVPCNTLDELKTSLSGRRVSSIFLYSELPEKNLVLISRKVSSKSIVFYEDPRRVVEYALDVRRRSFLEGVRLTSCNMAALALPLANPEALILPYAAIPSLEAMVAQIIRYLGLQITQPQLDAVAAQLQLDGERPFRRTLMDAMRRILPEEIIFHRRPDVLEPANADLVHAIIATREDISPTGVTREMVWPNTLFLGQDNRRNVTACEGEWLEMVGPARYLYFGPYLNLAAGVWSMKAELRVRGNKSGGKAEFDILQDGECLAIGSFDIPVQGVFEITSDIVNEHPEKPLEMRLLMKEGAIDGEIILDRVRWRHGESAFMQRA